MEAAERNSQFACFQEFAPGGSPHPSQLVQLVGLPFGGFRRSQLACGVSRDFHACVAKVEGKIYEPLLLWARNLQGAV